MTSAFPSELMNQGNDVAPEGTDVEPNSIVPTAASPFYGALEASSLCGLPNVAGPAGFVGLFQAQGQIWGACCPRRHPLQLHRPSPSSFR